MKIQLSSALICMLTLHLAGASLCQAQIPAPAAVAGTVYAWEEIPSNLFYRDVPVVFTVNSPGVRPPYSVSALPVPQGELAIDPKTGTFSFSPTTADVGNYHVTLSAHAQDGSSTSRQFLISVLRNIPVEYELVSQARPLPKVEDVAYINVTETEDQDHKTFNNLAERKLMRVTISGKTLIFDANKDDNGLVQRLNNRSDIETLNVFAETVVFRSRLAFPETAVHIQAREIRFEDQENKEAAALVTTPQSSVTTPGVGVDGSSGLNAGSITVIAKSIFPHTGLVPRFILDGGNGQPAGPGQQGPDGSKLACLDGKIVGDTCVIHVHRFSGPTSFGTDQAWPSNGGPAITPGHPGDPGDGGVFSSNLSLASSLIHATAGQPGKRADDVGPSKAGTPIHSLYLEFGAFRGSNPIGTGPGLPQCDPNPHVPPNFRIVYRCHIEDQRTSHPGPGATAPLALHPSGKTTKPLLLDAETPWLHPFALRAILNYSEDAYLDGNADYTSQVLDEYLPVVTTIVNGQGLQPPPDLGAQPSELQDARAQYYSLFSSLSLEMESVNSRLTSNLDYFGNPAGWVPQLSFQASLAAFSNEIDEAIPILYLSEYVASSSADRDRHIVSLQESQLALQADVEKATLTLNAAVAQIPVLTVSAQNVETDITLFEAEVQHKREELERRAQQNVDDRHSVPFWKQALNTLSAAAQVFPIGQPIVGSVGKGLAIIDNIGVESPTQTLKDASNLAVDFNQAHIKESVQRYHDQLDTLNTSKASSAVDYVKKVAPFAQQTGVLYKSVNDSLASHQAPRSEVEAELAQLEAADPEFSQLSLHLTTLNLEKETFVRHLEEAVLNQATLTSSIAADWQSVDAISQAIDGETATSDHAAVQEVQTFGRRTRDRLLKYQYYMAKAYEYRLLQPYTGDFQIAKLMTQIEALLTGPHNASYKALSPDDFKSLKALYEESVGEVIASTYDAFQVHPPPQSSTYSVTLSNAQLDELNMRNTVVVNLSIAVPHFQHEENRRLRSIDIDPGGITVAPIPGPVDKQIKLSFDHIGSATFRSGGHSYVFAFKGDQGIPFQWGGLLDPDATVTWNRQTISASYLDLLQTLLDRKQVGHKVNALFIDPGLDATVTIRRQGGPEAITALKLRVDYEYDIGASDEYCLTVQAPAEMRPLVGLQPADNSGRSMTIGSELRFFAPGTSVTLTAPQQFGGKDFVAWHKPDGTVLASTPTLSILMDREQAVVMEFAQ